MNHIKSHAILQLLTAWHKRAAKVRQRQDLNKRQAVHNLVNKIDIYCILMQQEQREIFNDMQSLMPVSGKYNEPNTQSKTRYRSYTEPFMISGRIAFLKNLGQ